jgi:hypothetical protein
MVKLPVLPVIPLALITVGHRSGPPPVIGKLGGPPR